MKIKLHDIKLPKRTVKEVLYTFFRIPTVEEWFNRMYKNCSIPYFPIKVVEQFLEQLPAVVKQLHVEITAVEQWNLEIIKGLFFKGLNLAALETIVTSVLLVTQEALRKLPSSVAPKVLELGCGAGWSTVILYRELYKIYGGEFYLGSCDLSIFSVALTAMLLQFYKIPYQIVEKGENMTLVRGEVVLQHKSFRDVLSSISDKLDVVYSNHGTTYMNYKEQIDLLQVIYTKLNMHGSFISDSLKTVLAMNLDKNFIIRRTLIGRNVKNSIKGLNKSTSVIKNGVVTRLTGVSASRFLDFMHFLLFFYTADFTKYNHALTSSTESQRLFTGWVGVSSTELKVIYKYCKLQVPFRLSRLPIEYQERYVKEFPYLETIWLVK